MTVIKEPAIPPKRIDTHRTDTLAVRKLFAALSPDWIIRDLSERDYGIDLMLEYYAGDEPTGQIVFLQVKGTSHSIQTDQGLVKFPLAKKTLLYAERFPEPFLLVHTSTNTSEPIYYAWIQKYISHVLDRDRPLWRTEEDGKININIPAANTFSSNEKRLLEISQSNILQKESLQFLSIFLFWEMEYSELKEGNLEFRLSCSDRLGAFKKLSTVIRKYNQGSLPNYKEIGDCLDAYDQIDERGEQTLNDFDEMLQLIKTSVLTEGHREQFLEEEIGDLPY